MNAKTVTLTLAMVLFVMLGANAATCITTTDGSSFTQTGVCGHVWTISKGAAPPSSTVWVDEYRNGALYSTGALWMQTDSAGNLAYNLDLPMSSGTPPTGSGYCLLYSNGAAVTVTYKNRATGEVLCTLTDTRTWVTGSGDNINHATFDNPAIYMSGGAPHTVTQAITANLQTDGKKAHTMKVKLNGAEIITLTSGVGSHVYQGTSSAAPVVNNGDVVTMELDGKQMSEYTVTGVLTDSSQVALYPYSFSINGTDTPIVTGAPTQTGTQAQDGNTTTDVAETGPDGTTKKNVQTKVNNPGTTLSGTGTGATNQDIYNDVKAAVTDAGNNTNSPGQNADATFTPVAGIDSDHSADTIAGHRTSFATATATAATRVSAMNDALSSKPVLGANPITVTSPIWTFAIPSLGSITVNLTQYDALIGWVRNLLLFIVTTLFCLSVRSLYLDTFN